MVALDSLIAHDEQVWIQYLTEVHFVVSDAFYSRRSLTDFGA